jgi:hypothetical protein
MRLRSSLALERTAEGNADMIKDLEGCLVSLCVTMEHQERLRFTKKTMLGFIAGLHEEYRKGKDVERVMQLYDSQEKLFARKGDVRESTPWHLCRGGCCGYYEKKGEAQRHLKTAHRMSLEGWKVGVIDQ